MIPVSVQDESGGIVYRDRSVLTESELVVDGNHEHLQYEYCAEDFLVRVDDISTYIPIIRDRRHPLFPYVR